MILPRVRTRRLEPGQILFGAGDPGDALYIVASGKVEILEGDRPIATLGDGETFGEMALLSCSSCTALARSAGDVELLEIGRKDFERLVAEDRVLARAVERLSHDRALNNLSAGTPGAASWATVASSSLERLSLREANKILAEGGHPRHHPWLLGHRLDLSRLGYLVADPDAGHVYRGHPRGGGKCRHAAPGWLACTDDLRPVVESSGGPARWQPPPATG